MVWYFIGVYIINRTLHGDLEIWNFSSRVEKYFTRSLRSLVKYYSLFEETFRISARPCNILDLKGHVVCLNKSLAGVASVSACEFVEKVGTRAKKEKIRLINHLLHSYIDIKHYIEYNCQWLFSRISYLIYFLSHASVFHIFSAITCCYPTNRKLTLFPSMTELAMNSLLKYST